MTRGRGCDVNHPGHASRWLERTEKRRRFFASIGRVQEVTYESVYCATCERAREGRLDKPARTQRGSRRSRRVETVEHRGAPTFGDHSGCDIDEGTLCRECRALWDAATAAPQGYEFDDSWTREALR